MMKVKSFTLIELTVVIAIIAVLAAVVAPNAFKTIEKSKITRMTSDLNTIKKASIVHYADTGNWLDDIYAAGGIPSRGFRRGGADINSGSTEPVSSGGLISSGGVIGSIGPIIGSESDVAAQGNDLLENVLNRTGWDGPYLEKWPEPPWDSLGGYSVSNDIEENFNSGIPSTEIVISVSRFDYLDVAEKIDSQIDDGDIGTGTFRFTPGEINPIVRYLIYRDGPIGKSS